MTSNIGTLNVALTLPQFQQGEWIGLKADIVAQDGATHTTIRLYDDAIEVIAEPSGDVLARFTLAPVNATVQPLFTTGFMPLFALNYPAQQALDTLSGDVVQIVFVNEAIAIMRNGTALHTFFLDSVTYPDDEPTVMLLASPGWTPTVTVSVVELDDYREAIYLDIGEGVIGRFADVLDGLTATILERSDGTVAIMLGRGNDTITLSKNILRNVNIERTIPEGAASDLAIAGVDLVGAVFDKFAERYGYRFAMLQLGSVSEGAKGAALAAVRRALEQATYYTITARPDVRVEIGDIVDVSAIVSGTQRNIAAQIVVEKAQINVTNDNGKMTLLGREKIW